VPLFAYPASEAPTYKSGYKVNAALWGVYLLGIPAIVWFAKAFPTSRNRPSDAEAEVVYITDEDDKGGDKEMPGKA
jgi:hypothetical protein